ncbi:MAG: ferritin [bacterium]
MLSAKIEDALNKQLNDELFSSYLYLSMTAYLETTPFEGFAHWMKLQSVEEYEHGMKFFSYLNEIGGKVKLAAMEAPKADWTDPQQVFEAALEHEYKITNGINNLVGLAIEEKDYATNLFLNYFVKEQVEEVASVIKIIEKFKMIGESKNGLFWLDKELKKRV